MPNERQSVTEMVNTSPRDSRVERSSIFESVETKAERDERLAERAAKEFRDSQLDKAAARYKPVWR